MKQLDNTNSSSDANHQPAPPRLDDNAEEQIEKIVDSIFANHRRHLREMNDLYVHELKTICQQFRELIRAAVEQTGVAGLRERLLWVSIGAMGAIIVIVIGAWLRFFVSF